MKRYLFLLALIGVFTIGCGNYSMFGNDEINDEDWNQYDYVFSGDSPDPDGEAMLFKYSVNETGLVEGETLGVFYAKFTGTLVDDVLALEMTYIDHMCEATAYAYFNGVMTGDTLTGQVMVNSCEVWEYDYTGELVGGALAE